MGAEFEFIDWVRQRIPFAQGVLVGPGDDTAVVQPPQRAQLITTDMLLEGSCFLLDEAGPQRVGRKAMAVNLSDIAAMAGVPKWAVVSVGLPRDRGRELPEQLHLGLKEMAEQFQVALVGGDTNTWNGPLSISVTLIGEATTQGAVLRSGAQVGDWIMVTGPLGGSILHRHLDFTPRVREALQLHEFADLHAMIDLSDGLAQDLHHICEESKCGAVLYAEKIPIHSDVQHLNSSCPPLEHALSDGEDFELVFTVTPTDGQRLLQKQPIPGLILAHIGEILSSGYWLESKGKREHLQPKGYQHHFGSGEFGVRNAE